MPLGFSTLEVLIGDMIAINVGGYALLEILGRSKNAEHLRSWDLRVYGRDKNH